MQKQSLNAKAQGTRRKIIHCHPSRESAAKEFASVEEPLARRNSRFLTAFGMTGQIFFFASFASLR